MPQRGHGDYPSAEEKDETAAFGDYPSAEENDEAAARTLNQEQESLLYNRNQFLPKPARSARPRAPRVSWWTVYYCNTIPITCFRKPCP